MQRDLERNNRRKGGDSEETVYYTKSYAFTEAAALLLVWSVIIVTEGVLRFVESNPSGEQPVARLSQAVMVVGAVFEVTYGLLGIFIAGSALFFKIFDELVTKWAMTAQFALSVVTFVVFVFVKPIIEIEDQETGSISGLVKSEREVLLVMTLLTGFHLCLALQGGQFLFLARLNAAATRSDFLLQESGNRKRAFFWNLNMGLAGLWLIVHGGILLESVGNSFKDTLFIFGPNTGSTPGMQVFTGLLLLVWAIIGELMVWRKYVAVPAYYLVSVLVYVMTLLNFTLIQFGSTDFAQSGAGSSSASIAGSNSGLVLVLTFLGPYFVHLLSNDRVREESRLQLADS